MYIFKVSKYFEKESNPITGLDRLWVFQESSRQMAHEGVKIVNHNYRPPLLPRKYSWYSFLLEAESTPGP
jgi:hypothetical protein